MRVVIDGEREEEQPSKASWLIQVMPAGRTHMRVADEPMGPCGRGHENADGAAGPQEQAELIKYINPLPDPWRWLRLEQTRSPTLKHFFWEVCNPNE